MPEQKRYKMWEHSFFTADMCEALIPSHENNYGEYAQALRGILEDMLSKSFPDNVRSGLIRCIQGLQRSELIFRRRTQYMMWRIPFHLSRIIDETCKQLHSSVEGDVHFLPFHCVFCTVAVIHHSRQGHFDVSIVLTSPYGGMEYIPFSVERQPKLLMQSILEIRGVPKSRITSEAFWACIFLSEAAHKMVVFTHYLSWLAQKTYAEIVRDSPPIFVTGSKSKFGNLWKSFVHGVKHVLRRAGAADEQIKGVRLLVKEKLLQGVKNDLASLSSIDHSTRLILKAGVQNVAMAVTRNGKNVSDGDYEACRDLVEFINERIESLPCPDDSTTKPPPELNLKDGWEELKNVDYFPFCENFRRLENVDDFIGYAIEQPRYVPVNFFNIPSSVSSFDEALDLLDSLVFLCARITTQLSVVKNGGMLIVSLMTDVFTSVLPTPRGQKSRITKPCIWNTELLYGQQAHCMKRLWQCAEFFTWASFSVRTTKEFDAQRIIVLGSMATIGDAVMRIVAVDHPSVISIHLRGYKKKPPFGILCGKFASQTENCVIVYPELIFTRCAILDYHQELCEDIPSGNVMWAWEDGWSFCKATQNFLRQICAVEGFNASNIMAYFQMERCGERCILGKYWEEYRYHRDLYILFKWMMAPKTKLPNCQSCLDCKVASPNVDLDYGSHKLQVSYMHREVMARAAQLRWPSFAIPSKFTAPFEASCEDDILHIKNLPTFDDVMGQRDAELLLSYLTAPYIRIPLILNFFATEDRVGCLGATTVKNILESVLFEPARFLPRNLSDQVPEQVPAEDSAMIATPYGILFNELQFSPEGITTPLLRLIKLAREMDAGTVHNRSVVDVILFLVRLAARVQSYVTFVLNAAADRRNERGIAFTPETLKSLKEVHTDIQDLFENVFLSMIESWIVEVMNFDTTSCMYEIDEATRTACNLHAHILLLLRNISAERLSFNTVSLMVSSIIFLTTRHTFNSDTLAVPETEIFDILQIHRRSLVRWMYSQSKQQMSGVMDSVVRVATSTGKRTEGHPFHWGYIGGEGCVGRFTRVDNDTLQRPGYNSKSVFLTDELQQMFKLTLPDNSEIVNDGLQDVEINLHIVSLTFKAAHLVALPYEVADMLDVHTVFESKVGSSAMVRSMQCAIIQDAEHRQWVRLVGQEHDIQYWRDRDPRVPLPGDNMRFYPDDLTPSEEWILEVVEPVRRSFFIRAFWQPPIFLLLPEAKLTAEQNVCMLSAVCSRTGKKLKEIVAFRDHKCASVYDLFSIGRRFYRRLVYTSDCHFSHRELQPSTMDRRTSWQKWCRHGAGEFNADETEEDDTSVVILRHPTHPDNRSKSVETFIPSRILQGLIPDALLETHMFWQDPDDNLRGYPTDKNAMHLLWMHWKDIEYKGISAEAKQLCFRALRFSRASSAPKVSESAILKSQKFTAVDETEEALERFRTTSTLEGDFGEAEMELSEGMFREATVTWKPTGETATIEDYNLLLLDLLYAPKGTPLHSLAKVLARIELLSHVLAWTTQVDYNSSKGGPVTIDLIQLPRLKLSFSARADADGSVRLWSLDHAHLFVSNLRPALVGNLFQGVPHCVILGDMNDSLSLLVPALDVVRPNITNAPFSTELVINRENKTWYEKLDTRYYLYPVHVSLSFLFTPTLASALYLLGLRFLHCEYEDVFKLATTIGTDVEFTAEEEQNFGLLRAKDERPEAHACRAKIGLLVADSPVNLHWYLPTSVASMIQCTNSVGLLCQMSPTEERRLLHIARLTLRKVEIIHQVSQKVKQEALNDLCERVENKSSILDGSLSERKQRKAIFEQIRNQLRDDLNVRVTQNDLIRLIRIWMDWRRYEDFDGFSQCLLDNRAEWLEAEARSIDTGKLESATMSIPQRGKDEMWCYYKDYNPVSCKVPVAQQKLKNDDQKVVSLSPTIDYFYCGTECRKSGMCKCKECGEECGPEVGCPCPSCERFNKANLNRLRFVPHPSTIEHASTRILSFYDAFHWIESLVNEDAACRTDDEVPANEQINQTKQRRLTLRSGNNSFMVYYEMMTGTTKVRLGSGDSAKDLVHLLFPLSREARRPEAALGHFMHYLLNNTQVWSKLPKWNRTSKASYETRVNAIYNAIISQAAQNIRYPPSPPVVPSIPTSTKIDVVARPFKRLSVEMPIRQTRSLPLTSDTDCASKVWLPANVEHLSVRRSGEQGQGEDISCTEETRQELRSMPLRGTIPQNTLVMKSREELQVPAVAAKLPFDLRAHSEVRTSVAKSMVNRLEKDLVDFSAEANCAKMPRLLGLATEKEVRAVVHEKGENLKSIVERLTILHANLTRLRDEDARFVANAFSVIERTANEMNVPRDGNIEISELASDHMRLRRIAQQETFMGLSYIIAGICSNDAESQWRELNPFLSKESCAALSSLIVAALLRANRVGHGNRATEAAKELLSLLYKVEKPPLLDDAAMRNFREALVASIQQKADSLAGIVSTKRVYIEEDFSYDPRFLIFEFTWNIVIRSRQRVLIEEMRRSITEGVSIVKQMIMGAGKTTVVGPLLALMLADSKNLVIQVVPPALLDFTRSILRGTFSCVIQKQVFCFICDRATEIDTEVLSKFMHARQSRGIVVTTPSSVKSVFLKFVEGLDRIEDASRAPLPGLEDEVNDLTRILKVWRDAVLIMDEVDLLLHPLKSELNFPIGAKHDIDFSPMRWKLPIHIIDGLFYLHTHRISLSIKDSPEAHVLLRKMADVLREGLRTNALQATPHLTLLNLEFYEKKLRGVAAQWTLLFLKAHHFTGLSDEETVTYITRRPREMIEKVSKLEADHVKTLNLSYDWVTAFLPHVLQKIDRVSFGIMNGDDMKRAKEEHPNMPRSRFVTAIPFIGKDLPSQSSEFAHPDVVIGLTILAYRYEGLRKTDYVDIMRDIHAAVEKEVGRFHLRRTNIMYTRWVAASGGRILQSFDYAHGGSKEEDEVGMQPSESRVFMGEEEELKKKGAGDVLPLRLMKQANEEESDKLYKLFRRTPEVIYWYLCENIFPEYMRHQKLKLSASGQEMGGNIMFERRVGFSGTPSDLLPIELGHCEYEPGTDGKLIHTLTSPAVMSYSIVEPGWTVRSVLDRIAQAQPPFHALIDTGALITGMSNLQVAQYLLKHGLTQMEGVVFLDEFDRKMILVRATSRVLKLAECGIPKVKRFAFYDQVHTTGMDIEHTPNAQAVQTLGKDMTFRDFSQGAFRMRGIAVGQTVHLMLIPEVYDLINRTVQPFRQPNEKPNVLVDVTAWLLVNSLRSEHVQHNQLCIQSVCNVWRKAAFGQLLLAAEAGKFKIGVPVQPDAVKALNIYREPVDYVVPQIVPQPQMFSVVIEGKVQANTDFITSDDAKRVVQGFIDQTKREDEIDNPVIDVQMVQEQEEEREAIQEREKEQEIEMEKFVDLAYSRDEEFPVSWAFRSLRSLNRAVQFYKLSDFHLYKRRSMAFPDSLMLSRNYFNPKWAGHRRLKNVIVTMEWIPEIGELHVLETPNKDYGDVDPAVAISNLERTLSLLSAHQGGLPKELIQDFVIIALGGQGSRCADIWKGVDAKDAKLMQQLLASNFLRQDEGGRFTVALALCEAETIRRIIHCRSLKKEPAIPGHTTHLALTVVPANNVVLDQTSGFMEAKTAFQRFRALQCFRFFDSDLHYSEEEMNILLRSMHTSPEKLRQAFFLQILACRRRARQRWERTPVSLIFNLSSPYTLLHQRTIGLCMRREFDRRSLHLGDAFLAINESHSGQLSPAELWGALRYCKLTSITADDVLDFVQIADTHHEGTIYYPDFLAMLTGKREIDDEEGQPTKDDLATKKLPSIDPYGAEVLTELRAKREVHRRALEAEANRDMETEEKRVREEIEQEQMREELELIQTCPNPRLGDASLNFDLGMKEPPRLSNFFGDIKNRETEDGESTGMFFRFNGTSRCKLVTRSVKLLTNAPVLKKYMYTVEFRIPRPKTASGKESRMPLLRMLEDDCDDLWLMAFPTHAWEVAQVRSSGNATDEDDDDEEEIDYEVGDYDEWGERTFFVYCGPDKKSSRVAKLHYGHHVIEIPGERLSTASGSVSCEWMKISAPVEGWVIFDEGGKRNFRREYVFFHLKSNGTVSCAVTVVEEPTLPPTLFAEEKPQVEDQDSDDEFWNDWRFASELYDEDDEVDEEEEEEEEDFEMGDLSDLVAALKKAKELVVGDKVSRNPECWDYGNQDGGPTSVGKVVKVEESTIQVQWPNGHKGTYCWGSQGKFEVIKVGSADEDELDREVVLDDQWYSLLKKKSRNRCSNCSTYVSLDQQGWFKCNQCSYHLCKKCFKNMEHPGHDFTDMTALSEALKSSEVVRGSTVRIREGIVPAGGWGDAPRDGSPGMVADLEEEQGTVVVLFNDEPWYGRLDEVVVVHSKWEQYAQCWLGCLFNMCVIEVPKFPCVSAVVDQSFVVQEVKGKFKVGDWVKVRRRGGRAAPGTIRAVLPGQVYAVDMDDGDHEPKQPEDKIRLIPFQIGTRVRVTCGDEGELPDDLKSGSIGVVNHVWARTGWELNVRIAVQQGMKRKTFRVSDENIEVLGQGKWFCRKSDSENLVGLPTSSVVILERSFTDGVVPKSIHISGREYGVSLEEMLLTDIKTKQELKLIRQPEEPFVKKRDAVVFDDGKWHMISILVDEAADPQIRGFCDGKPVEVEYNGPECDDECEDEEDSEPDEEKESEKSETAETEKEYAVRTRIPDLLDEMAQVLLRDRPEVPLEKLIAFLQDKPEAQVSSKGGEVGESEDSEEEEKQSKGDSEESAKPAEKSEEDASEEWEDIDDEGDEGQEEKEEQTDDAGNEVKGTHAEKESEKTGDDKPSSVNETDGIEPWKTTDDGKHALEGRKEENETKGEGGEEEEGEESSSSEPTDVEDIPLPSTLLQRTPAQVLALDVRDGVIVMGSNTETSGHRTKYGSAFPVRHASWMTFAWGSEASEAEAKKLFETTDAAKRWKCQHCGALSSRLLDACIECGRDRVRVDVGADQKIKIRSLLPKSREAQEIRKRMHARLRSQYQKQLDALEDYSMLL